MKIAIAQINTTIGDFKGNAERMLSEIARARREKADLAVFPELTTCGYPARDLLEKPLFIQRNLECVEAVARGARDIGVVIGFAAPNEEQTGRGLYNVAALLADGKIAFIQEKSLLPEYDVFDEARHFEPARERQVCQFRGRTFALSLCEDIWGGQSFEGRRLYACDPIQEFVDLGAEFIINISASPYVLGKRAIRESLATKTAQAYRTPLVYCNLVGGNDELIFDGQSMAVDAKGTIAWEATRFQEDRVIVDIDALKTIPRPDVVDDVTEIRQALILGIRDYMRKCGFSRVVIGVSGGVDSAVVASLASEAIGPKNVTAAIMPSPYTSKESLRDAKEVVRKLGIEAREIPIGDLYKDFRGALAAEATVEAKLMEKAKAMSAFARGKKDVSVTEENIQARIRGNILMAISNREGSLVLSTGNKSELSVGYCTLYGDMAGGLAVISDVPKTMVYKLARYYHEKTGSIPQSIIDKPPSAELKPDQKDQDSLPPYDLLDQILKLYIEEHLGSNVIIDMGYDEETVKKVVTMVELNEYKRRQAAPGLKVTSKAFGSGRRFPIARKMYW